MGTVRKSRRAVLRQAADARGVFLGDEVMDYMLTRFSRDLGSLMELLDLLREYRHLALDQRHAAVGAPRAAGVLEHAFLDDFGAEACRRAP